MSSFCSLQNHRDLSLCSSSFPSPRFQQLSFQLNKRFFTTKKSSSHLSVLCIRQPKVAVVTRKSWEHLITKSDTPVLVEFYASWCGPCRMVHRVIDELATEYADRLKCYVLQADEDSSIAELYDIKAVPVVLFFKNGEKCDSVVGTMPKEFYSAAIDRVLSL